MTYKEQRQPGRAGADRIALLKQIGGNHIGNSKAAQCVRILEALHVLGSVTTVECSRYLDVVHPPRRVMELRGAGNSITTAWHTDYIEAGEPHRVGRYVLNVEGGA
jgi:hypothetical protein